MKTARSPIRYPGGKGKAIRFLDAYLPSWLDRGVCSPFAGGLNFELYIASRGTPVHAYDIYKPLLALWKELKSGNRAELLAAVKQYLPMDKQKFHDIKANLDKLSGTELAAAFYVLSRTAHSGNTSNGGYVEGRLTEGNLRKLEKFVMPANLHVEEAPFWESIPLHPELALYLDPPYLLKEKLDSKMSKGLYGSKGSTHNDFDHLKLKELLDKRDNWIMSYDNHPEIIDLYRDYFIFYPSWQYGMTTERSGKSREILIVSSHVVIDMRDNFQEGWTDFIRDNCTFPKDHPLLRI